MKLLIIGIDGATFDLIRPWAEAGHLPNLARLMRSGVQADLASTLPPVTSPAWPTFMTGCNPGKHGVFDFIQPIGADYSLVNASKIKRPTLWQQLSAAGYRVGVLNVPVTYLPRELSGFVVSGILNPKNGQIAYPADLISRYEAEAGPYRVAPRVQYKAGMEDAYIADIHDLIRAQGEWALTLIKREPVDVMMVRFTALDILMHALWRFMDESHPLHEPGPHQHAIRDGYRLVDEYVGRMVARLPESASTIVMSDHGFGPLRKIVNLNVYLMERGLLKLKQDTTTRLKAAAFRMGLSPAGIYRMIETMGLQNLATRVSQNTYNQMVGEFLSFDSVDWSQTVAYSMGHVGQIYLNVAGREPEGIVTAERYKEARARVIAALHGLRDEDGRSLVSKIIVREETYHGPYSKWGPDIHVVLNDYNLIAFPRFATNNQIITDQIGGDSGCHRREGIFIAWGPAIRRGEILAEADILDLAPTILGLLGEQIPGEMDGRVLQEAFTSPLDVTYDESEDDALETPENVALGVEEEAQIQERLRGLGYL